jgi:L-threonylcarbamoyladenylate synthase
MTSPERIPLRALLDAELHKSEKIESVAGAIRKGALFVYPTETIYGLGGAYTIPGVREKIDKAKRRPADQPMIFVASRRSFFSGFPVVFPEAAERLARAFWPGMLTLVLPSLDEPRGIAIRVSDHPFIRAIFRHIDMPLYSTSANLSGSAYVNDPDLIYSLFRRQIDFMVDAGPLPALSPSTVVKVTNDNTVTVLREGAISAKMISAVS